MESSGLGTSNSKAASLLIPKPLQSGQNPIGALKEKSLGSNFGTENPHIGQVCRSERTFSSISE